MTEKISIKKNSDKFQDWIKQKPQEINTREFKRIIPEEFGSGEISSISLRKGLNIGIMNFNLKRPLITGLNNEIETFGLRFSLSGKTRMKLNCLKDKFEVKKKQAGFFYFPEMTGESEEHGGERIARVVINIDPVFLNEFVNGEAYSIPDEIKKLIDKKDFGPFNVADNITPPMQFILRQIIDCPFTGLSRHLFIESKILELMVHGMEHFQMKTACSNPNSFTLNSQDLERVYLAEKYLLKNIQKPPDLALLSREAGMSRSKLIICFTKTFGASPAEYIRSKRFETAKSLLENGKANVTDAAYSVGYSNLSYFSRKFKNYYGIHPGYIIKKKQ